MSDFFNDYFNIKKIYEDKKEYREMMARVDALPEDYRFVYKKIQDYMWAFGAGSGYDMMRIQYDLVELFEAGAAEGRPVLAVTGKDVAEFADELLRNARTYARDRREKLNREIMKRLGGKEGPE